MFSQYNPTADFLKIISSFAIIWFHTSVLLGHKVSYSGLIFFMTFSVVLLLAKSKKENSFYKLYKRYIGPWFFWIGIYGVGNLLLSKPFFIQTDNILYSVLAGSHYHLWYLPFMFIALVFLEMSKSFIKIRLFVFWFLLILWVVTANYWRPWSISEGVPVSQYIHGFGAVCFGVLLSTSGCWNSNRIRFLLFIHLSIFLTLLFLNLYSTIGVPYLIGIFLVYIALLLKSKFIPLGSIHIIKSVANLTFGIYLTHPLFIYLLKPYADAYVLPIIVFIASVVFVYILKLTFPKLSSYAI